MSLLADVRHQVGRLEEVLGALVAPRQHEFESKPSGLELVLTGSHERPEYLIEAADLVTNVRKERHPIDAGQRARKGTEY